MRNHLILFLLCFRPVISYSFLIIIVPSLISLSHLNRLILKSSLSDSIKSIIIWSEFMFPSLIVLVALFTEDGLSPFLPREVGAEGGACWEHHAAASAAGRLRPWSQAALPWVRPATHAATQRRLPLWKGNGEESRSKVKGVLLFFPISHYHQVSLAERSIRNEAEGQPRKWEANPRRCTRIPHERAKQQAAAHGSPPRFFSVPEPPRPSPSHPPGPLSGAVLSGSGSGSWAGSPRAALFVCFGTCSADGQRAARGFVCFFVCFYFSRSSSFSLFVDFWVPRPPSHPESQGGLHGGRGRSRPSVQSQTPGLSSWESFSLLLSLTCFLWAPRAPGDRTWPCLFAAAFCGGRGRERQPWLPAERPAGSCCSTETFSAIYLWEFSIQPSQPNSEPRAHCVCGFSSVHCFAFLFLKEIWLFL